MCLVLRHEITDGDGSKVHKRNIKSSRLDLLVWLIGLERLQEFLQEMGSWKWLVRNRIKGKRYALIGARDFLDDRGCRGSGGSGTRIIDLGRRSGQFGANIMFGSLGGTCSSNNNRSL